MEDNVVLLSQTVKVNARLPKKTGRPQVMSKGSWLMALYLRTIFFWRGNGGVEIFMVNALQHDLR